MVNLSKFTSNKKKLRLQFKVITNFVDNFILKYIAIIVVVGVENTLYILYILCIHHLYPLQIKMSVQHLRISRGILWEQLRTIIPHLLFIFTLNLAIENNYTRYLLFLRYFILCFLLTSNNQRRACFYIFGLYICLIKNSRSMTEATTCSCCVL